MTLKIFRSIILLAVFARLGALAHAQEPFPSGAQQISHSLIALPLFKNNPAPMSGASLQITGATGQAQYCYWAESNFQVGSALSYLGCIPNGPNTLSMSNYVTIFPAFYPAGVVTVDFLETPTSAAPSGACNCAVSTGVTSGSVNQTSNTLSSYTVPNYNPLTFALTLSNEVTGSNAAHLILRQGWPYPGTQVADLSNIGASGVIGSGTNGNLAGWTSSSAIGNVPCTYTTSPASLTCNMPQTSPTGTGIFELFGGALGTIGGAFYLSDATGYSIRDNGQTSGTTGLEPGINIGAGVPGQPSSAGLHVWGSPLELLEMNNAGTTFGALPVSFPVIGAASTPGITFPGAPFSGGTGTTTEPLIYTGFGTAATTWSTNGTVLGMNQNPGFNGNFVDFRVNGGSSLFAVTSGGAAVPSLVNQPAANSFAGSCAMSTGTTCTFTTTATFTSYLSFASIDHASTVPATANSAKCSLSGTTATITAGISNSLTWDCLFIGNPN